MGASHRVFSSTEKLIAHRLFSYAQPRPSQQSGPSNSKSTSSLLRRVRAPPKRGRLISAVAETRFQARDSPSVVYSGPEYTLPLACGRARREHVACMRIFREDEDEDAASPCEFRHGFVFRMSVFVDCSWSCESQGRLDFESTYRCLRFHRLCARWPSRPSIAAS